MKPVVGIVPLVDFERNSLWMLPGYMNGIAHAGGTAVMLPLTDDVSAIRALAARCDGLLFSGGQDVGPECYGEAVEPFCGARCPERDRMEALLLQEALRRNLPVLGICRGLQFLNVALGGTLYQDLPAQRPSPIRHRQTAPYGTPTHQVLLRDDSPLRALLGRDALDVNSYHHQGVKALSPRMKPMACAPDGLVEAAEIPELRFGWAVQWHPEFFPVDHPDSAAIFGAFVNACSV